MEGSHPVDGMEGSHPVDGMEGSHPVDGMEVISTSKENSDTILGVHIVSIL